jgi:hypothetical protein
MADIWVAAAWMIPLFLAAAGGLLFGYLRFFRLSQAEEQQAASALATVRQVRPPSRMPRGQTRRHALAAGSRAA